MKRVPLLFIALLLAAAPALAQTKPAAKTSSHSAARTPTAYGTVVSVDANALVVRGKSGQWTFAVDDKTHVTARGASHKTAATKSENKSTQITDLVKVGDEVGVKYHQMGTTRHAADVTVFNSMPGAKPKK
jgi:hypothetical protein